MHDVARNADHFVQHRDHILLEGYRLNFSLVHDSHEQAEEGLALQQIVAMVQVCHLLCLLVRRQDLTVSIEHNWISLLTRLQILYKSRTLAVAVPIGAISAVLLRHHLLLHELLRRWLDLEDNLRDREPALNNGTDYL